MITFEVESSQSKAVEIVLFRCIYVTMLNDWVINIIC